MINRIETLAGEILEKIIHIRHDIHQHPETGYNETRTAGIIETFLDEIDLPHKRYAGTGIAGVIGSGKGHVVGLRSEMDALKTSDHTDLPYTSTYEGISHACGHDGHIAVLLGTAWVLKQMEDELKGTVKLIWQPAEEGGAGARKMIEEGVLEPPTPEAIFSLHGWPSLDLGKVAYRFGPAMASVDNFEIIIKGKSAHSAMPHTGVDPVTISSRVIEGVQLIRTRMINPLSPLVITIATIHGGTVENIIPDEVKMTGTIRTIDPEIRSVIPELIENMAVQTAQASGGDAVFNLTNGYPPTINEKNATAFARDTLCDILGKNNVVELDNPVMGGEDFAYFLEKIAGTFMRLGVGDRAQLHNSSYDFNDEAIPVGIRVMTGIAVSFCDKGLG